MEGSRLLRRVIAELPKSSRNTTSLSTVQRPQWTCTQCLSQQRTRLKPSHLLRQQRRSYANPADSPGFTSIVDNPPTLIRSGRKHNKVGIIILATIPITAFVLGCWQVQRLGWKTDLIAKFEDRLIRDPLPLPPRIDPEAIKDFDYRRVYARGRLMHDKEMLIGPRLLDGEDGYLVVTPLDRSGQFKDNSDTDTRILINRGWIPKDKAPQSSRPEGLPSGEVIVQGLLREPWKKNMFTPSNEPQKGKWYFPDVYQMAEHSGSQAVWIEETMKSDLLETYRRQEKGIPIGRPPEVNLRNNHTQYIFTWFSLSLATSIMLWMVLKKPPGGIRNRVRQNKEW
ncbi:Cytochrome oxidase assembly protein shy1 [Pseudocercospora fuligena]|uniref:SURF1-like protein n=1 Tax=Pseudocercospora fuligena TaxID=685502 RepID=A0A8H6VJI0_9PEZI|nr:Cytochrome oxidase assembly protein shy1 [Pseudocercospora fuligena]